MSTTSDWLEQHVAQAKTDALTKLTQPKPTPQTPAPVVSLDPGSDTGTLGDNITADQTISIRIANPTGLTWYDANGNAAFDPGTDVAAVGGLITLTLPQTGANTLVLYQQASGQTLSAPTYFTIYVDPVANALQQAQFDQTLQTLALAYWGRALVPDEITVGRMMLDQSHGDTTALVAYLAQSPEFLQNYQGMSIPWAISDIFQNLYGRAPTAGELSTAFSLISHGTPVTQLPALIAENPATAADRAALAAKLTLAQEFTRQHDALLQAAGNSLLSLQLHERQLLGSVRDDATLQQTLPRLADFSGTAPLSGLTATLDPASDSGVIGDGITTNRLVTIDLSGIQPGALAWLDVNHNGAFDPGTDIPAVGGKIVTSLTAGANALTFYQTLDGKTISTPTYLTLRYDAPSSAVVTGPTLDLRSADDDGPSNTDNVTTVTPVHIDVSGLDPSATLAWIDLDGNGTYNPTADIALPLGAAIATVIVPLKDGVNGLRAYQTVGEKTIAGAPLTILHTQAASGETTIAAPVPTLDPKSDTNKDGIPDASPATIALSGVIPGAIAWLDVNHNGAFDPGTDVPAVYDQTSKTYTITATLQPGANALTFYQTLDGKTLSPPAYLTLQYNAPAVSGPALDLNPADDDGPSDTDNITTASLVRIDVSGIDAKADFAWIDLNGNGIYDHGTDITLPKGQTSPQAWVPLNIGINTLRAYETIGGQSIAGDPLTIIRTSTTDVVTNATAAFVGTTLSLSFSGLVDWRKLDANKDGLITVHNLNDPNNDTGELKIAWGATGGLALDNDILSAASAPIPDPGSRFISFTGITATDSDANTPNSLTILVVGVPNLETGTLSDVLFKDIS
jgi:hypothetical protein